MAANRKEMSTEDHIFVAAREALEEAGGDLHAGATRFESVVRSNPVLREALLEPLVGQACYQAVAMAQRSNRRAIWVGMARRTSQPMDQSSRVALLAAGTLAMFPLPGGKPLGQATREEIGEAAEFYSKQASDMGVKARWLTLVAQHVPAGKTVSEILSSNRLRELQEEARRG